MEINPTVFDNSNSNNSFNIESKRIGKKDRLIIKKGTEIILNIAGKKINDYKESCGFLEKLKKTFFFNIKVKTYNGDFVDINVGSVAKKLGITRNEVRKMAKEKNSLEAFLPKKETSTDNSVKTEKAVNDSAVFTSPGNSSINQISVVPGEISETPTEQVNTANDSFPIIDIPHPVVETPESRLLTQENAIPDSSADKSLNNSKLDSKKLVKIIDNIPLTHSLKENIINNPKIYGLTKTEFENIENFCKKAEQENMLKKSGISRFKADSRKNLPRTLFHLANKANGLEAGWYINLSAKGGLKSLGEGGSSRATLMLRLSDGELLVKRSCKRTPKTDKEMDINKFLLEKKLENNHILDSPYQNIAVGAAFHYSSSHTPNNAKFLVKHYLPQKYHKEALEIIKGKKNEHQTKEFIGKLSWDLKTNQEFIKNNKESIENFNKNQTDFNKNLHNFIKNICAYIKPLREENVQKTQIIMDYISGGNLKDKIENEFDQKNIKSISQGLLKGLKCLHDNDLVHCDLKPENILLDGDIPKIIDFDLCVHIKTNQIDLGFGTQGYMAPEIFPENILQNQVPGKKIDIWAFGCILGEMAYGKKFKGMALEFNNNCELRKFEENRFQLLKNKDNPKHLDYVINQCLQSLPDDRPDINALDRMLKNVYAEPSKKLSVKEQIIDHPEIYGLTKEEFEKIEKFCSENSCKKESNQRERFVQKKSKNLPRTVYRIDEEKEGLATGWYVNLNTKGGVQSLGEGGSNRATLVLHLPDGKLFVKRSGRMGGTTEKEIKINNKLMSRKHKNIAAGVAHEYQGSYTSSISKSLIKQFLPKELQEEAYAIINRNEDKEANIDPAIDAFHDEIIANKEVRNKVSADISDNTEATITFRIREDICANIRPLRQLNQRKVQFLMKHIQDGSLKNQIKNGLEKDKIINITKQIAEGINHLHKAQIVHGDLKSENILLDGATPKIIDFNMSVDLEELSISKESHADYIKMGMGSPGYIAPELIINFFYINPNREVNKIDMWALGVILGELAYGEKFKDFIIDFQQNLADISREHGPVGDEILNFEDKKNNLLANKNDESHLDYIIDKCLQANPWVRISIDRVVTMLKNVKNV